MKKENLYFYLLVTILVTAFLLRLFNVLGLPIFVDEVMYLEWGRLITKDWQQYLWISYTDGQQPLYIWLMALAYKLSAEHSLFLGRFFSILTGLGSLFFIFKSSEKWISRSVALGAGLLYAVSPFTLWYDRLAIKDSLLMFLAVVIFWGVITQIKQFSWLRAVTIGLFLGAALWTKSIAYFFIGLYPLLTFILELPEEAFEKPFNFLKTIKIQNFFSKTLIGSLVTVGIGVGIGYLQELVPQDLPIGEKDHHFLLSFSEVLRFPWLFWLDNTYSVLHWLLTYLSWSVLGLSCIGSWILFKKDKKKLLVLFLWICLPIVYEILFATIFFPRYFLFTCIAWFILAAQGLVWLWDFIPNKYLAGALTGLLLLPNLWLDWQIVTNPQTANLPSLEQWQYQWGWPSGYNFDKVIELVKSVHEEKKLPLLIIAEKESLISLGLPYFLPNADWIDIKRDLPTSGQWQGNISDFKKDGYHTLIIVHLNNDAVKDAPVKQLTVIPRWEGKSAFYVYELEE